MKHLTLLFITYFLAIGQSRSQEISNRDIVLDHIFVWTSEQNQIQSFLKSKGFNVFIGNEHSGQGTIGCYLFFYNVYIEFLSVSNESDFRSNAKANNLNGMMLKENWKSNKVSPFGIGLHLKDTLRSKIDFSTFNYSQVWMKPGTYLKVANSLNSTPSEPMIFIVPDYIKMNQIKSADQANKFQLHSNNIKKTNFCHYYMRSMWYLFNGC